MTTFASPHSGASQILTFSLPDPGEGLASAEILEWVVAEGDQVSADQHLLTVETAKATIDIPSPASGRIAKLTVSVGDVVAVGAPLFDMQISAADTAGVAHLVGRTTDAPAAPVASLAPKPAANATKVTPTVRRLARSLHVSLASLQGSGPGGQITPEDVQAAAACLETNG